MLGPPKLAVRTVLLPEEPDVVALVLVVATAWLYVAGVRRLAQRGRSWPHARTGSFLGGLALVVLATQTGIARYDTVLFSMHVAQHVLLSMVAPVFIVLGAPVTLALQGSSRPTKRVVLRLLHHPVARALTHPVVATAIFSVSLFVLYLSGLFELSLRNGVVHAWVHFHLVVVGCLFAATVVGRDPMPVRWPHSLRLLLVALTVPAHAILGLTLLSAEEPLAGRWYESLGRTWGASPLADQRTGAGVLWAAGELIAVGLALIVMAQWMRHSEREARRADRRLDAELAAARGAS